MSAIDIGITLKGLVLSKNTFKSNKTGKDVFNVTLVVGGEHNPVIWMNEKQYSQFTEMEIVEVPVVIGQSEFNGEKNISYQIVGEIKKANRKAA